MQDGNPIGTSASVATGTADKPAFSKLNATFTFVREPIAHFLSGFDEVESRRAGCLRGSNNDCLNGVPSQNTSFSHLRMPSKQRLLGFLRAVLRGERLPWDVRRDQH